MLIAYTHRNYDKYAITIDDLHLHLSKYIYFNSSDCTKYFYTEESKRYCELSTQRL